MLVRLEYYDKSKEYKKRIELSVINAAVKRDEKTNCKTLLITSPNVWEEYNIIKSEIPSYLYIPNIYNSNLLYIQANNDNLKIQLVKEFVDNGSQFKVPNDK